MQNAEQIELVAQHYRRINTSTLQHLGCWEQTLRLSRRAYAVVTTLRGKFNFNNMQQYLV